MSAVSETPLVLFEFTGDDWDLRRRVLEAMIDGKIPYDQWFRRGFAVGDGRRYSGLWFPQHAPAVRAWAESNGIRVTGPLLAV
jgi:hypothetical protein